MLKRIASNEGIRCVMVLVIYFYDSFGACIASECVVENTHCIFRIDD